MSELVVTCFEKLDVIQLLAMGIMFWFFYSRLDRKIDKLGEKVEDIDRRLCRIEGSLSIHGHCLFNQAKPEQRAQ